MKRTIEETSVFRRDLKKLPRAVQARAWHIANRLAEEIFDATLDVKKLMGFRGLWRVKVGSAYRMVFTFDARTLVLLRIKHRKEIYRPGLEGID